MVKDGNTYETMNWTAFSQNGAMVRNEYTGTADGKTFYRIEVDNRGGETPLVESNLYFDYKTNAALSNISFKDAVLVGHEFKYKTGFDEAEELLPDGRLKYVLENKFVPFEYEYDVTITSGQKTVTFTPVAMSDRITAMTVNGNPASSRCPITVDTGSAAVIEVTGPDGATKLSYTLNFVTA